MSQRSFEWWLGLLAAVISVGLAAASVLAYRSSSSGLGERVALALPQTRVANPVTAVLMDLRGYDTMLEVGVLLLAWCVANALGGPRENVSPGEPVELSGATPDRSLARLLLAPLLLLAAYMLWRGADGPGGALQAGAITAAAAVTWRLVSASETTFSDRWAHLLAPAALGAFLIAGIAVGVATGTFLDYPVEVARELILAIEAATLASVGCILAALFEGVLRGGERR